ncbi:hypothetical protein MHZ93_11520 [Roseomonas sp. ACRSG]|nr:hypothetical protein [Roseomonas sp. ACRSG]
MQNIARFWPSAILVSGLLLAATDLPLLEGSGLAVTLGAVGFLGLLAFWRAAPAWTGPSRLVTPPARRITIRIRCSR